MALKPDKTVLMVMVDALRHDYITAEDAPFLYSLGQQGACGSLIPSFGFEPDSAYFAGLNPEECDGGTQYWRKPGERVFHLTRFFSALHAIPSAWWRKQVRRGVRLVAQLAATDSLTRMLAPSSEIPLEVLRHFSMPMRKLASEPGFCPAPTLFDTVRACGRRFYFHGFPAFSVRTDAVRARYLAEERGGHALAFLFLGDLDGIGHRYGPASNECRDMLRRVDAALRDIHEHAQRQYQEVALLVFGDHGMAEVRTHLDLRPAIRDARLDTHEDLFFLDSTFARFWVADASRRERLVRSLAHVRGGHVIGEEERERFRIRYPHNYFGDVIFAVDDHVLIHPSYYCTGNSPPKGMHGYLPSCRDNESAFVLHAPEALGRGNLGRLDMRRVFPTMLGLLGLEKTIPIPHNLTSILA